MGRCWMLQHILSIHRLFVCLFVLFVHPAKATEQNGMPSGVETYEVWGNIVLDRGHSPSHKGEIWAPEPPPPPPPARICIANCGQTVTYSRMVTVEN